MNDFIGIVWEALACLNPRMKASLWFSFGSLIQQMSPSDNPLQIVVVVFVGALVFDVVVESDTSKKEKPSQVKRVHFVSSHVRELS